MPDLLLQSMQGSAHERGEVLSETNDTHRVSRERSVDPGLPQGTSFERGGGKWQVLRKLCKGQANQVEVWAVCQ